MVFGTHSICSAVLINSIFLTVLLSVSPTILCFRFLHGRWRCCNCSWSSLQLAVFIYRLNTQKSLCLVCFDRWICTRAAKWTWGWVVLHFYYVEKCESPLTSCTAHSWSLCLYDFFLMYVFLCTLVVGAAVGDWLDMSLLFQEPIIEAFFEFLALTHISQIPGA